MGAARTAAKENTAESVGKTRLVKTARPGRKKVPRARGGSSGKTAKSRSPKITTDAEREFMRPDPDLDRHIIHGMLYDREGLMSEYGKQGISEEIVLKRAADCGVNDSLLRQVRGVEADLAGGVVKGSGLPPHIRPRQCLSCDRVFLSLGPGNRLCMRCRGGDAGLAAP